MYSNKVVNRFWNRVNKSTGTECWLWTGTKTNCGYGVINVATKMIYVHRFSYELAHDCSLTTDECVCHACDVRLCVNPAHLWIGTKADNLDDMRKKGRARNVGASQPGSTNPFAVLTESAVLEIRRRYFIDHENQKSIARSYGITQANVSLICTGKSWGWLK